ncbi:MAG: helix-hairpin-helix domain-containing protein [Prevotellaceae bacterium]|nr:helix-hairpin-helix domain-containing protein [Prevotellaceae bacterium]
MKHSFTTIIFLICTCVAYAQGTREWEQYLFQLGEIEDIEASTWETYYDYLYELEENPLNINTATREDLEQIPFLSVNDVESISEYLYKYGPMRSLGELALIEKLDYFKRKLLFYFTYAGEEEKPSFPKLDNILKYGKHNFLGSLRIPLYERKGDKNGYEGYQYKHSVKYEFTYGDYVKFGFLGSQDSGEPFFAGKNNLGYDFYSYYLLLKKLGRIKTLAIGKYRVQFGLGLVINNNFSFGKISALTGMGRTNSNIRAHSSRSSGNYLQGAATTINIANGLDASVFVSYRKLDATLNDDNTIATIVTSGYHRTKTELEKKGNSSHLLAGCNLDYRWKGFQIGATAVYTSLDKELKPKTSAVYRKYYANGKNFYNVGVNYSYVGHRISFYGETATGDCKAIATVNSLNYSLTEKVDIMAVQRFYSKKYYSLYSNSFSEGGSIQNESGIYLGLSWRPMPLLNVLAYSDYAYFSWPKYQAAQSSRSFDNLIQIAYTPDKWAFTARYRLKLRERDNEEKTALIYKNEHRGRLSMAYNGNAFSTKTQMDVAYTKYKDNSFGWMITQNCGYKLKDILYVNASFGYFHTKDYNSRVYTYEKGLLYSFSSLSFYGEGIRYALSVTTERIKNLMIIAKVGTTDYFDRNTIGSGYQLIDHSSATDIDLQVRWKF